MPLSALRATSIPFAEASPRISWRAVGFAAVAVAYLLLTLAVVFKSPVLQLDTELMQLHLRRDHPGWFSWIYYYVMFGQRGPATLAFLPCFLWVSWRRRSTEPLVLLALALVLLNLSVGIVKVATGRFGPLRTHNAHDFFAGGNIYPSGHVSNAVVLYGLLAWIAMEHRKLVISAAVFLCLTIGAGTIYLDTHWFSDVVGGWLAGALVLLALPTFMPFAQRWFDAAIRGVSGLVRRRRSRVRRRPVDRVPAHASPIVKSRVQAGSTPVRRTASAHSFAATVSSFDALEDPTRCG